MVRRHGWKLFIVIALAGLIPGVLLLFAPHVAPSIYGTFGHEVPAAVTDSEFFLLLSRWIGTVLVGGNLLTVFIASTALRRGERWAWWAMWYWPAMFASHLVMYEGSSRISQAVWLTLSVAVLVALRPTRDATSDAPRAPAAAGASSLIRPER